MISKNEPLQYQIINWLDNRITRSIKGYTECNLQDKCFRVFSNFRIDNNKPVGIKLTRFGNSIMGRYFDKYDYENECLLNGKVLLKLDEAMTWPDGTVQKGTCTYNATKNTMVFSPS